MVSVSIHIAMVNKFIIGRLMNLIDKISQKIALRFVWYMVDT